MAKPTSIPIWASGPNAAIIEPSPEKKALGWQVGELPPAEFFNWLAKGGGDWFNWLASFGPGLDLVNTWTNSNILNGPVGDENPCLITQLTPVARKLLWKLDANDPEGRKAYLYLSPDSGIEIAYNCSWNNSIWVPDHLDDGFAYYKLTLGPSGLRVQAFRRVSETSWTDAQWTTAVEHTQSGIKWISTTATYDGANPSGVMSLPNQLCAKNTLKAWALLALGPTPRSLETFNVIRFSYQTNTVGHIAFSAPMANAYYSAVITCEKMNMACSVDIVSKDPNYLEFVIYNTTGAQINLAQVSGYVNLHVFGIQET